MYSLVGVASLGLVWLVVLSFLVWRIWARNSKFWPKGKDKALLEDKILEIENELVEHRSREKVIFATLRDLADDGMKSISKVEIVRYNPYNEVGGDQSFTLVLLNNVGTGVVVTSLHSRSGTRIYSKEIIEGKSDIALSEEERKALKRASEK